MSYTRIAQAAAGGAGAITAATTAAINTTGADLIVAAVGSYSPSGTDPTAFAMSDSKGNSWTAMNLYETSGAILVTMYWSRPTSVGSGHTFTFTAPGANIANYPSIAVAAYAGSVASPVDQQNGNTTGGSGSTVQPNSITPSEDSELVLTACAWDGSVTMSSINGGFAIEATANYSAGNAIGVSLAHLIQATAAAANPTWTLSGSANDRVAAIASFKSSGGGGAAGQPTRKRWGGVPFMGSGGQQGSTIWRERSSGLAVPSWRYAA